MFFAIITEVILETVIAACLIPYLFTGLSRILRILAPKSASPRYSSTWHFHQQIHHLYSLAPYGILGSLINGGILIALLWTIVPKGSIALWGTGLFILNGLWSFLLYRYRQETHHATTLDRWVNWFLAGNVASGCIWGLGGIVLYPSTSIGHEIFLRFVFGGMVAGATALYASHFPAFLAFALPTATPILHRGLNVMPPSSLEASPSNLQVSKYSEPDTH